MDLNAELSKLRELLKTAWCRETSYYKDQWTPEKPATGQCKVTSMLVQEVMEEAFQRLAPEERLEVKVAFARAILPDGSEAPGGHFFNEIGDQAVDLTRDQFPETVQIVKKRNVSKRFLFRDPDTEQRFNLLKNRCRLQTS